MPMLEVENLSVRYGPLEAVRGIAGKIVAARTARNHRRVEERCLEKNIP